MSKLKNYDVIYLGVGVSTVIHFLKNWDDFKNKKICFIEKDTSLNRDKTISGFTSKNDLPVLKKFNQFECRFGKEVKSYESSTPYFIFDLDKIFDNFIHQSINCDFYYETTVDKINKSQNFKIITNNHTFTSPQIFDSRPPAFPSKNIMKQHFVGWFIQFEKEHSISCPVLMDIDLGETNFCFTYILPISMNVLLVERTYYSQEIYSTSHYESLLKEYIKKNFSNNPFKTLKKEKGVIPLISITAKNLNKNYTCLGVRGGYLRSSTGYSITSFVNGSKPSTVLKVLDQFLLKILWCSPKLGGFIFMHFLRNIDGNALASFMSDKPKPGSIFRAIKSMPFKIFIPHLFKLSKGLKTSLTIKGYND